LNLANYTIITIDAIWIGHPHNNFLCIILGIGAKSLTVTRFCAIFNKGPALGYRRPPSVYKLKTIMHIVQSQSDAELLAGLQSGRGMDECIRTIYRKYFDPLSWFILNNNGSVQDAEDIFQEVVLDFVDAVQKNKFRGESSIKTFLFSLNKHAWLNELKRRGRAMKRELKYEKAQDREEMDVSQVIASREARQQVINVVDQLGEGCKKILLMFYYENLSMKEILDSTEYETEQVVRNKKYKCLKQLEQMLTANPILKESLKKALHG